MFRKTYTRWIAGAGLTLALVLGGSLLAAGTASAQTPGPSATAPAAATTPAPATTPGTGTPNGMLPGGHGPGGPGGRGMDGRGPGAATTADGAANMISRAEQAITLAKSDLTYATGKMDTANVEKWLTAADGFLAQAKSAQTAQQYGQAGAYAEAAEAVTRTAETAMAQALGADKLPSYSQQSQLGGPHGLRDQGQSGQTTTPTQAQVSRELQRTYNQIVSQGALAGTNADAAGYLTQARDAYKTAYSAYQAGDYAAAHNSAELAQRLLRVADSLLRVADAGTSPDAPVTVPAPNF